MPWLRRGDRYVIRQQYFEKVEDRGGNKLTSYVIQARIEHQRKLEDAREKHKEWWNLDESGRTVGKAAETINEAGLRRREENRVDASGVTRGGVYGSR